MHTPQVPLNELAVAVQNAVQQTLAKHGAVPVGQLWVGFVAPENLATLEAAQAVAGVLGKEAGVHTQPSVAQLGGVAAGAAKEHAAPIRIIGLTWERTITKQ
jgi:hypothetical protein